jgi:hypothetical protein
LLESLDLIDRDRTCLSDQAAHQVDLPSSTDPQATNRSRSRDVSMRLVLSGNGRRDRVHQK